MSREARVVKSYLSALRRRVLEQTKSIEQADEAYLAELIELVKRLELYEPAVVEDLQKILDSIARRRLRTSWLFGNIFDRPLEEFLNEATNKLYRTLYEQQRIPTNKIVTEASIRNELRRELVKILIAALEQVLLRWSFIY